MHLFTLVRNFNNVLRAVVKSEIIFDNNIIPCFDALFIFCRTILFYAIFADYVKGLPKFYFYNMYL